MHVREVGESPTHAGERIPPGIAELHSAAFSHHAENDERLGDFGSRDARS